MIIGITGFKDSGKDTVADILMERFMFLKYSFAKPLKDTVGVLFGWSEHRMNDRELKEMIDPFWGISPRQALQFMGTEVMREHFPKAYASFGAIVGSNFWVKKAEQFIQNNPGEHIVIPDCRFQNEVDLIHSLGGITVKVVRQSSIPKVIEHASENVDLLENIDFYIMNNGSIADLDSNVWDFAKKEIVK